MPDDDSSQKGQPAGAAVGGAAGGAALVGGVVFFKQHLLLFFGILVVLLILLLGGYLLFVALRKKRQGQAFGEGLRGAGANSPRGISDPGKRAKLEDLRQKFEEGIKAYQSRGKDLYSLPWYVIVGEPGGGKSEAIRRSNIGFPPGLQDEFQGVGGTINMHWWFSDHAVLLDTAGRMIFEEVAPGESSEWKEFLGLLQKTRPTCPINGLLLVIPCDSLIKDSESGLDQKARKLAQQLDLIQRSLDIRFPVSVLVTKCDLLPGFREYFENLKDPKLQQQMLGWSNPNPLDTPFKPEEVDGYLQQVTLRLARRRLAMLRDPAPESPQARRADEVDSLYSLPNSLTSVAPRLRRYLEQIFQTGSWSLPPLFLRGIYFSSSLREGAALDADLASALGLPVDSVGDFKVWEKERSFFLKDLFVQKVFKERGLVTRATNTQTMMRSRRLWLFGVGTACLVVFLALAWLGMSSFKVSIASQANAWHEVSTHGWDPQTHIWSNSLVPLGDRGLFKPVTNTTEFNENQARLGYLHEKIRAQATNKMTLDWIAKLFFSGLATEYNQESVGAQRIVFETGVIYPLISAAKQKFRQDAEGPPPQGPDARRQLDAFKALLELQADIQARSATNTGRPTPDLVRRLADPLTLYVAGTGLDTNLVNTWSWLYSISPATLANNGLGSWPPAWLTDQSSPNRSDLVGHDNLRFALQAVVRAGRSNFFNQSSSWSEVTEAHERLKRLKELESQVWVAASEKRIAKADQNLTNFLTTAPETDLWLNGRFRSGLLQSKSLKTAVNTYRASAGVGGAGPLAELSLALTNLAQRAPFDEIVRRLKEEDAQLGASLTAQVRGIDGPELDALDRGYLTPVNDKLAFAARSLQYTKTQGFLNDNTVTAGEKIGRGEGAFAKIDRELQKLADDALSYQGPVADEFRAALTQFRVEARQRHISRFYSEYQAEVRAKLGNWRRYPLDLNAAAGAAMTLDELKEARQILDTIQSDLGSAVFRDNPIPSSMDRDWKAMAEEVGRRRELGSAIFANNVLNRATIHVLAQRSGNAEDAWRDTYQFIQPVGGGNFIRAGFSGENTKDNLLGTLPLDAPFEFVFKKRTDDPPQRQATGRWGALELVRAFAGQRDPQTPDGTTWLVEWPVRDAGGKVRLRLKFDRPMSTLDAR